MNSHVRTAVALLNKAVRMPLIACFMLLAADALSNQNQIDVQQLEESEVKRSHMHRLSLIGRFERSDGEIVRAANSKLSSMGSPPTKCMFVFPDGAGILVGSKAGDCLVWTTGSVAELYRYESNSLLGRLLPFASRVQQFDGYNFQDATTPGKRLFSLLVHYRAYRFEYSVNIFYFALLAALHFVGKRIIKPNPKQWWLAVVRGIGKAVYVFLMVVCIMLLMVEMTGMFNHTLFSVYAAILGIGFVLYKQIDKLAQRMLEPRET